ncbi:MAG: phosphatidate cytidylyltransferase [Candidatus Marinimicrobia bacterium]|jgi:dolichol kinase|nr:phosphatidate cytidylyltransferase [Candidatus Neomarinimicrobiota bacterium]MBT3576656.1 phosphatidate cytidylyltransferase [Candidatus Neomarinimicrobiota bacterium]MBT3678912.1 phosphatidate cytidylyltransferase [Candidatus Neomarinimicrobiota bacterium]MBT3952255.1 phosphatidate cytidylyltransferase [Candidatus Neomarinimicrobiota bacterium]MBT4252916.1 phosphatidate cytidylyltransferase [Candidatus Neomarinimicrobiota bacterium]
MSLAKLQSHELIRKAIHLSSSIIPLSYWFLFERHFTLQVVIFLALGFLTADFLRLRSDGIEKLFMRIFGSALRQHEKKNLTGATYVFTGSVVAIFLFPKEIAVPALLILSISDTLAALIGIPFGKHKFLKKSAEGSTAFFISTAVILAIYFPESIIINIIIAAIVTLAEAYPMNLDDNFLIPILSGTLLSLASLL